MFILVCYSVHDRNVVNAQTFHSFDKAAEAMKKSAKESYKSVRSDIDADQRHGVYVDIDDDCAQLSNEAYEETWTWHIIKEEKS